LDRYAERTVNVIAREALRAPHQDIFEKWRIADRAAAYPHAVPPQPEKPVPGAASGEPPLLRSAPPSSSGQSKARDADDARTATEKVAVVADRCRFPLT
jgi:hypothetical protein